MKEEIIAPRDCLLMLVSKDFRFVFDRCEVFSDHIRFTRWLESYDSTAAFIAKTGIVREGESRFYFGDAGYFIQTIQGSFSEAINGWNYA